MKNNRDIRVLIKKVKKMRKEAEKFAEQDKKKKEEIDIINQADSLVANTERTMKDFKGKVDGKTINEILIQEIEKII